jgi:threonine dehydrogenase-like Zn-dependent dehydrogenase
MRRQAIIHQPYDVRLDEIAPLAHPLGDFELLVRTEISALSPGTETRIYTGTEAARFSYRVSYPFTLGYNNVARVIATGSRVQNYQPGQRIFTRMPHISEYVVGERTAAVEPASLNSNVPASYSVIAAVPASVTSEEASLTHLLTLGFNALHRGQYRFGETVMVIGLGVVGLGAVCMAHVAGARVAAIGNAPLRLEVARQLGACEAWLAGDDDELRARRFAGEEGIDMVVVCADSWSALKTAIDLSRRNTRIVALAFPGAGQGPAPFDPFEPSDFYNRSLSYVASSWMPTDDYAPEYQRFTVPRIYRYILDLMARQRIRTSSLVTHRFPIDQIQSAFQLALTKDKSVIGIVFDWNPDE